MFIYYIFIFHISYLHISIYFKCINTHSLVISNSWAYWPLIIEHKVFRRSNPVTFRAHHVCLIWSSKGRVETLAAIQASILKYTISPVCTIPAKRITFLSHHFSAVSTLSLISPFYAVIIHTTQREDRKADLDKSSGVRQVVRFTLTQFRQPRVPCSLWFNSRGFCNLIGRSWTVHRRGCPLKIPVLSLVRGNHFWADRLSKILPVVICSVGTLPFVENTITNVCSFCKRKAGYLVFLF